MKIHNYQPGRAITGFLREQMNAEGEEEEEENVAGGNEGGEEEVG